MVRRGIVGGTSHPECKDDVGKYDVRAADLLRFGSVGATSICDREEESRDLELWWLTTKMRVGAFTSGLWIAMVDFVGDMSIRD